MRHSASRGRKSDPEIIKPSFPGTRLSLAMDQDAKKWRLASLHVSGKDRYAFYATPREQDADFEASAAEAVDPKDANCKVPDEQI
jgi:hypothetical protein